MKASSDTPAQPANQGHHIHTFSSVRAQPAARLAVLTDNSSTAAAHLSTTSAQANLTGLPRRAAIAHPATATANASARVARGSLGACTAGPAPASDASLRMPAVPARQPARPPTQRLDLNKIWGALNWTEKWRSKLPVLGSTLLSWIMSGKQMWVPALLQPPRQRTAYLQRTCWLWPAR